MFTKQLFLNMPLFDLLDHHKLHFEMRYIAYLALGVYAWMHENKTKQIHLCLQCLTHNWDFAWSIARQKCNLMMNAGKLMLTISHRMSTTCQCLIPQTNLHISLDRSKIGLTIAQ